MHETTEPQPAPSAPGYRPPSAAPSRGTRSAAKEMAGATDEGDGAPVHGDRIDLEQVRATARRYAREANTGGGDGDVRAGGRAERFAALTQARDAIVERREADGWVVRIGGRRCVIAPVDVPHFMRGITVVPACEAASR